MADDEFEYQYDTNETSTFLVELDLSTLNGIKRDIPRRYNKRRKNARAGADEDEEDRDEIVGDDADFDQAMPAVAESRPARAKDTLQILEGDSLNPIVAYKGSFYSCTWQDLIGTDMFYSLPHQGIEHVPLRSTRNYNLLGTSRVKLVGQRAKVSEKAARRKRQRVGNESALKQNENAFLGPTSGQSDTEAGTVRIDMAPAEIQEQTAFLERLKAIQQSRQPTSNGTSLVDRQASSDVLDGTTSDQNQDQNSTEKAVRQYRARAD